MKFVKVSKKNKSVHTGKSAKAMNRQFLKEKNHKANNYTMRYSK